MVKPKGMKVTGVGVSAKLAWAAHHFKVLDGEIRPWADSHLDCIVGKVHNQGKTHVYRPQYVPDIPDHWSLLIGDCLHNARAALDHLAHQLVRASGGEPTKRTSFPISLHPKRAAVRPKVAKAIRREVEAVQPDTHKHWMEVLRRLDNVDKHRTVLVVSAANTGARQSQSPGVVKLLGSRLQVNKPVGRVDHSGLPQAQVNDDVKFPVGIAFDEAPVRDVNVGLVLRQTIDWIDQQVIPRFQPFVPNLDRLPDGHWTSPPDALPI